MQEEAEVTRKEKLKKFCLEISLPFKDLGMIDLALHHSSYSNENKKYKHKNNERLEFLGDAVLDVIAADLLFTILPASDEGELSYLKSAIVSESALAKTARKLKIGKFMVFGKGEEKSGGREKDAVLADAMEALIGACYMERGFGAVKRWVTRQLEETIQNLLSSDEKDYKTLLQEWTQKTLKCSPIYKIVNEKGKDHEKTFSALVIINEKTYGPADGKTKKTAEKAAAKIAWSALNQNMEGK